MGIGGRLGATVAILVAAAIVILGWRRVVGEQEFAMRSACHDRRYFGRLIRAAVAPLDQTERVAVARAMVDAPENRSSRSVHLTLESVPDADALAERLEDEGERSRYAANDVAVGLTGDVLTTLVPLGDAVLVLREPRLLHAHLASIESQKIVTASLAVALAAWLAIWIVTRRMVTQPLVRLGAIARRIGQGDLSVQAPSAGKDEVSVFTRELHAAAERLRASSRALAAANAERMSLMHTLRHGDRLRTVGVLAASIAHELGTPLATVQGYAQLIEGNEQASPGDRRGARIIVEQTGRMAKLVRGLLDFGRSQATPGTSELATVSRAVADMLEPHARKQGVTIDLTLPEKDVQLPIDRNAALQVIANLVGNAVDASPRGSAVELSASVDESACSVRVRDHGPGIAEADLPHLFEPFFTTKAAGEGTGLGLSVARGIVMEHGGTLEARNREGGGAEFVMRVPLAVPMGSERTETA